MPDMGDIGGTILNVLKAVGGTLGNLSAEYRASKDADEKAMMQSGLNNPDLLRKDIPHNSARKALKSHGWTDEMIDVYAANAKVNKMQAFAEQAQQFVRTLKGGGGQAGGVPVQSGQAPAKTGATPMSATGGYEAPPIEYGIGYSEKGGGYIKPIVSKAGAAPGQLTGFAKLQADREAAVLRGDYRNAKEIQDHINVLNTSPDVIAGRTKAAETAKLDPAIVKGKLDADQIKTLQRPISNVEKRYERTDGQPISPATTYEEILAQPKLYRLKRGVQDKMIGSLSKALLGRDLWNEEAAAGGQAPVGAPQGGASEGGAADLRKQLESLKLPPEEIESQIKALSPK